MQRDARNVALDFDTVLDAREYASVRRIVDMQSSALTRRNVYFVRHICARIIMRRQLWWMRRRAQHAVSSVLFALASSGDAATLMYAAAVTPTMRGLFSQMRPFTLSPRPRLFFVGAS